ncbi:MAG: hypothetical protein IKA50_00565 [Clostridia bacterium]|nr:hypothetical protein [Clostridia bacterium]
MAEVLKDRYGSKCGEIRQSGSELVVYDRHGVKLATYRDGKTYDKYGSLYGYGNWLAAFLK